MRTIDSQQAFHENPGRKMADLKNSSKSQIEGFLEMKGGYVCDFTNREFKEFVLEHTGVEIYSGKYSGSKAMRLREFWDEESNYNVSKLLGEMIEYWKTQKSTLLYGYQVFNPILYEECKKTIERLKTEPRIADIGALRSKSGDERFSDFWREIRIRESIREEPAPRAGPRQATHVIKFVRELCSRHAIFFDKNTPLHSLFGLYVKFLEKNNLIESQGMSKRILKSSISILEA